MQQPLESQFTPVNFGTMQKESAFEKAKISWPYTVHREFDGPGQGSGLTAFAR